jgi:hypothetical protein
MSGGRAGPEPKPHARLYEIHGASRSGTFVRFDIHRCCVGQKRWQWNRLAVNEQAAKSTKSDNPDGTHACA